MIRLAGIERVFVVGGEEVHALRAVDLEIGRGEYLSIMGPSGSGKSTLLNVIGLLDRPNSGHYILDDRDVTGLSDDELARVRREKMGFVFQFFHLVPRLTAAQNIALPMVLAGIDPAERARRPRWHARCRSPPASPCPSRPTMPGARAPPPRAAAPPRASARWLPASGCWRTACAPRARRAPARPPPGRARPAHPPHPGAPASARPARGRCRPRRWRRRCRPPAASLRRGCRRRRRCRWSRSSARRAATRPPSRRPPRGRRGSATAACGAG